MSMLVKLGVVAVTAGLAGLVTVGQLRPAFGGFEMQALASLASLTNLSASAPAGAGGPLDKTFSVRRVHIDKMVAQVELVTAPQQGPIRVQANGAPGTLKELQVRIVGDEVFLRLDKDEEEAWFPWNLFNMWFRERKAQDLKLRITAPAGTPYDIEDMIGSVIAGDLDAPLSLEGHALTARFGRVQNAKVSIAGSGRIALGAIKETLDLEVAGSGHFTAVSAAAAQIEIAGAGEVNLGPLAGGLSAEVAGSGDIRVARVNGPVDIEIAGSGSVAIDGGQATPFQVEIAGSGDVLFKGHAVDPNVQVFGSGDVTVGSYSGRLTQEVAGSGDFKVLNQGQQPSTPVPPAPPVKQ